MENKSRRIEYSPIESEKRLEGLIVENLSILRDDVQTDESRIGNPHGHLVSRLQKGIHHKRQEKGCG
jgi:hypothetical protein